MKKIFYLLPFLVLLSSCSSVKEGELGSRSNPIDMTAIYPKDYKTLGDKESRKYLKDPYSAKVIVGKPYKQRCSKLEGSTYKYYTYWYTLNSVNAKNSFGAYTGAKQWEHLYKNGKPQIGTDPTSHVDTCVFNN